MSARRAPLPALALALASALVLVAGGAARAQPGDPGVDLLGTWHVLVHYQDSATNNPDAWRWQDRIWEFAREGSRLRWRDYPLVVFDDESGRFEKLGTNRQSRILAAWEPNEGQLEQIREGLEINPRGSKTKTLRGGPAEGWTSGTPRGPLSASVLTYQVTWSIEQPDALPVFRIEESLGGARAESLDGVTLYETEAIEAGGDVLRGRFSRDGTRVGRFRLMRAGSVGEVSGRSEDEGYGASVERILMRGIASSEAFGDAVATPSGPDADTRAVRQAVHDAVAEVAGASMEGEIARVFADDITDQVMKAWREGASPRELREKLRDGEIKSNLPLSFAPR